MPPSLFLYAGKLVKQTDALSLLDNLSAQLATSDDELALCQCFTSFA